ncbi:MAG: hypothetical protein HXS50_03820 [Theionarchaea archaeon]|nr:hypothetical protein [Theionarchaea archaeon]
MANRRANVVFIRSDQHSQAVSGCYGHDIVRSPYIDGGGVIDYSRVYLLQSG